MGSFAGSVFIARQNQRSGSVKPARNGSDGSTPCWNTPVIHAWPAIVGTMADRPPATYARAPGASCLRSRSPCAPTSPQRLLGEVQDPVGEQGQHAPRALVVARGFHVVRVGVEEHVARSELRQRLEIGADLAEAPLAGDPLIVSEVGVGDAEPDPRAQRRQWPAFLLGDLAQLRQPRVAKP